MAVVVYVVVEVADVVVAEAAKDLFVWFLNVLVNT